MGHDYDDTLNDDACHPHVLRARCAGRAWAEREWDALVDDQARGQAVGDTWRPSAIDALPLVEFGPASTVEDQTERESELSEVCNIAAEERWHELAGSIL